MPKWFPNGQYKFYLRILLVDSCCDNSDIIMLHRQAMHPDQAITYQGFIRDDNFWVPDLSRGVN